MRFLDASVRRHAPGPRQGHWPSWPAAACTISPRRRRSTRRWAGPRWSGRQAGACRLRSYAINDSGRDDQHRGRILVADIGRGRRPCGRTRGDPGRLRRQPLARGPWAAHAGPKFRARWAGQEPAEGFAQCAGRSVGSRAGADTDGSASAQLRVNLRGVGQRGSFRRLVGNTCCRASRPSCE